MSFTVKDYVQQFLGEDICTSIEKSSTGVSKFIR